ncbi:hypothetical protein AO385_2004 [Moraxella catarrhalis]|uniref:Uncharacterized protein n=1 Tax=Moraxella catarrhalis TaxID=480 RepID=A0A198UDU3_MORCA|nr:hypothetical protein AO384_1943 [Moraxella catarrhalis]OAU95580.1 hypothetical protein AO385_2004 [Moraxella catarrhalis]OAU96810.1 hypothetical protein AO383_1327 [Moraxella catarrhalis]
MHPFGRNLIYNTLIHQKHQAKLDWLDKTDQLKEKDRGSR